MSKNAPSYLDSYLAIVECDLIAEQRTINQARLTSSPTVDLSVEQIQLHMKRRAIDSLRTPIAPRS